MDHVQLAEPRSPRIAVVFLQPHCNMKCTFCITEDNFDVLEFDAAVALLDHLVERKFATVVFGGGEPFTWQGDVVALARAAKHRDMTVQISTNGVALPDDFATLACVDRYVLPLEAADPVVHDAMRHHACGHHARILHRMAQLRRAGKSLTVSTVLTATNAAGILDLAAFLRDYQQRANIVHAWHLFQFIPVGRGGRVNAPRLGIPVEEYRRRCDAVRALDLPFPVFRRPDMYRPDSVEFFCAEDGALVSGGEALDLASGRRSSGPVQVS